MQKHVNLVDLVKSFPINNFLQNSDEKKIGVDTEENESSKVCSFGSILDEKSENGSMSNLSTKVGEGPAARLRPHRPTGGVRCPPQHFCG